MFSPITRHELRMCSDCVNTRVASGTSRVQHASLSTFEQRSRSCFLQQRKMARLFLLVLFCSFRVIRGEDVSRQCNSSLGVSDGRIPNHRFTASSTYHPVRHAPHLARLNASDKTQGWCSHVASIGNEYLEIDLGQNMRVSAVGTEGVYVRDEVTGRLNFTYVKEFGFTYRRDGEKKWRVYMENEVSITLFKIDENSTDGVTIHRLLTPRIARYVRFAMDEGRGKVHERWCMRVEIYGCIVQKQGGLVSYKVSQGNPRRPGLKNFRDIGYDGTRTKYGYKPGVLSGGLGQLTDGILGKNAFWNDTNDSDWLEWIGWRDVRTRNPTITFEFDTTRRFSLIRFHVLNHPGHAKLLFDKLVMAFSNDGEYYSWKVVYEPSRDKRMDKDRAFFVDVDTGNNVGKFVTCDFTYDGYWILISEVEFVSKPVINGSNGVDVEPSDSPHKTDVDIEDILRKNKKDKETPLDIVLLTSVLSVIVLVALLLFLAVLCRRRRHKRRRQAQGAMELFNNRVSVRIVNPNKKNSLNRRNDQASQAAREKLAMLEDCDEDMDRQLEMEEEKLMNNRRKASLQEKLLKADADTMRNLRPESKDISIEEEKAQILEEERES